MPKVPDFSKFDLQGIINSVKSVISPEPATPNVAEGDPIGAKIVQISTLLQSVTSAQTQAAKELTQINTYLNELYKDLESFRKLEAEFRQKQTETVTPTPTTGTTQTSTTETGTASGVSTHGQSTPSTGKVSPSATTSKNVESTADISTPKEEAATKTSSGDPTSPK